MIVAVGSMNPAKMASVYQAFETMWPTDEWDVRACSVHSGVSNQPMSDSETCKGARLRALRARDALDADYGVGLEGGLQRIGDRWFNSGWVVVVDKAGYEGVGTTIRMIVPYALMTLIQAGHELGDACDFVFKDRNTKHGAGHFGLMTNSAINRTSAFKDAVMAALAVFLHRDLMELVDR